jgi:hypothetical protein
MGTSSEPIILQYWKIPPAQNPTPSPFSLSLQSIPSIWTPPEDSFIKLNFDGASKGNPRATGYGVIFQNHQGHILLINARILGHTMNNAAELWGLTKGLQLATEHNFTKLIVEGDSLVIINLFRRILNGADPN